MCKKYREKKQQNKNSSGNDGDSSSSIMKLIKANAWNRTRERVYVIKSLVITLATAV